jgi:hypothetical protein
MAHKKKPQKGNGDLHTLKEQRYFDTMQFDYYKIKIQK